MNQEIAKRLALGMAVLCVRNTCIEGKRFSASIMAFRTISSVAKTFSSKTVALLQQAA